MNKIKSWLKQENIHLHLSAKSELETIWTMLDLAAENHVVTDSKKLARSIYDNEILHSSHRGCSGITFFSLTDAVNYPLMLVGRFEKGIGYFSKENKPIDLVVLLAAPESYYKEFRSVLLCIKEILCDHEFMEDLRYTDNTNEIYQRFLQQCQNMTLNKLAI